MIPGKQEAEVAAAQKRVEAMIESNRPLRDILVELVRVVESLTPSGMLASILVLDEDRKHLLHGAGPSLPPAYNDAIDGLEIGPDVGSCGTAAFHAKPVAVFDIANDRLWANFRDLALQHGLRACWSTPIRGAGGEVLGTFANYYRVVRDPSPIDQRLTDMVTRTAARAIEHDRATRRDAAPPAVAQTRARSTPLE